VFEFVDVDVINTQDVDTPIKPLGIYSSKTRLWTHPQNWECPIRIDQFSSSRFFRGVLYLSSYRDKVVAAIDMEGNSRAIPIPTSYGYAAHDIYVSQGQLYLAISSSSQLSIWALEGCCSAENWTLKHKVSYLQLFGEEDSWPDYDVIIHPEYKVIFLLCRSIISTSISITELMSYDMDSRELHSICDLGYDCKGPYLSYVPLFSRSLADGH
jgi:hypothetical protein